MERVDFLRKSRRAAVALALLAALAQLGGALRGMRTGGAHAPPPAMNAVMVGLGGFRGILAEALWFRMEQLQLRGRHLEITQLADWITRLDPHAAEAWVYNAWNLAYNVSAMMRRPEDRLRWVANGVALLRDDALEWVPDDPRLYRELAWMYQHKIGASLDSAHGLYKFSLASLMAPLCDGNGLVAESPAPGVLRGLRDLRLDPAEMRALQAQFGPLDWRMPASHALYWGMRGVACSDAESMPASRRAVCHALVTALTEQGVFAGDLEDGVWDATPNAALAEGAERFVAETCGMFPREGMLNVYARVLAERIRLMDAEDPGINMKYAQFQKLAPPGFEAVPLGALRGAAGPPPAFFVPAQK